MKSINFPVFQLVIAFTLGIIAVDNWPGMLPMLPSAITALGILNLLWWHNRTQWRVQPYFGWASFVVFFLLGAAYFQVHQAQTHGKSIEVHFYEPKPQWMELQIRKQLKSSQRFHRYTAKAISIAGQPTKGTLLLHIAKEACITDFFTDEIVVLYGTPTSVKAPKNPGQFDYAQFLSYRGISHQTYVHGGEIARRRSGSRTLQGRSSQARRHLISQLEKATLGADQRSILLALLLGERNDIDRELYADYAAAGAVHILAVSGLHVGILLLIFQWLLYPIRRLKHGRKWQLLLSFALLWGFACLTGLSPSVSRAVTMFSCFGMAQLLGRSSYPLNSLILSFFILLLINPNWLFQVGFQLSYAAVAGILVWQPKWQSLWRPKWWLVRKIWTLSTVSLSAQLGVLPLTLYYFHQFPGLFLLTNLLVMPFLGLILIVGILLLVAALISIWVEEIAYVFDLMVTAMNGCVRWIAGNDQWVFSDISFSLIEVLVGYVVIGCLMWWVFNPQLRRLQLVALAIFLFLVVPKIVSRGKPTESLTVFHQNRKSLLGHQSGGNLSVFSSENQLKTLGSYPIEGYRMHFGIKNATVHHLPMLFRYDGLLIQRLDSLPVWSSEIQPDVLWLTHSPKIHLNRWIDSLQPRLILADGSNYISYIQRWSNSCQLKEVDFYYTGEDGAWVLSQSDSLLDKSL